MITALGPVSQPGDWRQPVLRNPTLVLKKVTSPHDGAGEWSARNELPAGACSSAVAETIRTGLLSPGHCDARMIARPLASLFMAVTPAPLHSPSGGLAWRGSRPAGSMPTFDHMGRLPNDLIVESTPDLVVAFPGKEPPI